MSLRDARSRLAFRADNEDAVRGVVSSRRESLRSRVVAAKRSIGTPSFQESLLGDAEPIATVPPVPITDAGFVEQDGSNTPLLEDRLAGMVGKPPLSEAMKRALDNLPSPPGERPVREQPAATPPMEEAARTIPVPPTPPKTKEPLFASFTPRWLRKNEGIDARPFERQEEVLRKPDRPAVETPVKVSQEPVGTDYTEDNHLPPRQQRRVPTDPGIAKPSQNYELIENNLSQMVETENNIKTVAKELFNKGSIELKSEVTHNEINHITRIRFLGEKFRLANMDYLTDNLLSLRVSKNRKSRNEFISALQSENRNQQGGGFWQKMFGNNNRNEPN